MIIFTLVANRTNTIHDAKGCSVDVTEWNDSRAITVLIARYLNLIFDNNVAHSDIRVIILIILVWIANVARHRITCFMLRIIKIFVHNNTVLQNDKCVLINRHIQMISFALLNGRRIDSAQRSFGRHKNTETLFQFIIWVVAVLIHRDHKLTILHGSTAEHCVGKPRMRWQTMHRNIHRKQHRIAEWNVCNRFILWLKFLIHALVHDMVADFTKTSGKITDITVNIASMMPLFHISKWMVRATIGTARIDKIYAVKEFKILANAMGPRQCGTSSFAHSRIMNALHPIRFTVFIRNKCKFQRGPSRK